MRAAYCNFVQGAFAICMAIGGVCAFALLIYGCMMVAG